MPEPERVHRKGDLVLRRVSAHAGGGAYLPRALKQMLDGTLGVFAERIGRQLFKLAVEQNVNNHILASDTDIDAARYMKMHTLSMEQVKGTNGKISFVDVLQQERAL